MKHALIIESDDRVSHTIEEMLAVNGFTSFDHAWSEDQAIAAAARRSPDLLVVGTPELGSPFDTARRICERQKVPILVAKARGDKQAILPPDARLTGPFPVDAMDRAVREAERQVSSFKLSHSSATNVQKLSQRELFR